MYLLKDPSEVRRGDCDVKEETGKGIKGKESIGIRVKGEGGRENFK